MGNWQVALGFTAEHGRLAGTDAPAARTAATTAATS